MARRMQIAPEQLVDWETGVFVPGLEHKNALLLILNQAESNAEKVQRRPLAEVIMREQGLSQIHDLEVSEDLRAGPAHEMSTNSKKKTQPQN